MIGQSLNWRVGDNLYLLIFREINDDFMVLIKVVEQDPDLEVKNVHPSVYGDIKTI